MIINPYRYGEEAPAPTGNNLLAGLESYWKLDEPSGTTATDSHGSNDGTISGATVNQTGILNKAYDFDGTNDDIDFGDVLDFERTDAFSISAWVNPDTDKYQFIYGKIGGSSPYRGYAVVLLATGKVNVQIINTNPTNQISTDSDTTILASSGWNHVVVTYDGSSNESGVKIYINGSSSTKTVGTDSLSATISNTDSAFFGSQAGGGAYFDGTIDEVGIWSRVLTPDEISDLYSSGSAKSYDDFQYDGTGLLAGLESYWDLDEASGTVVDSHGSNDGTVTGATYGATGIINDCLDFEASSSDYINTGTGFDYFASSGVTVSAWIKVETLPTSGTFQHIYTNSTDNTDVHQQFVLWNDSGTQKIYFGSYQAPTTRQVSYSHSMSAGTWYHVVGTEDGSGNWGLYIDGVSVATASNSTFFDNADTQYIGAINLTAGIARTFDGLIDEVGVWSRALQPHEIQQLYNDGNGNAYGEFRPNVSDLISYWSLDEASGTVVDSHGSNDGTVTGATYGATGIINDCLDFERADSDYVDVGTGLDFYNRDGVTVSAWIKIETLPTTGQFMSIFYNAQDANNTQLYLDIYEQSSTQKIRFGSWGSPNDYYVIYNHSLSTATWYHIVGTHDGTNFKLYIDGVEYSTSTNAGAIHNNSDDSSIGARDISGTFGNHFDGLVDEVGVWYRELTAGEISWLYNSGSGRSYNDIVGDS